MNNFKSNSRQPKNTIPFQNEQGQIVISRTTYQYMFDTIDTNADGKISSDELMNYSDVAEAYFEGKGTW